MLTTNWLMCGNLKIVKGQQAPSCFKVQCTDGMSDSSVTWNWGNLCDWKARAICPDNQVIVTPLAGFS